MRYSLSIVFFVVFSAVTLLTSCAPTTTTETKPERPTYTLWFDTANRVHRTAFQNEATWRPTWVIIQNGDVVLERNALNETIYQYFRNEPGIYTIYLKAWTGQRYEVASNVVSYRLE